ncbi:hypothetical protein F5Y19DRAFT_479976 [Xylariaceae sp. FL1651]|nr:hypothetical protein F5Y19DRAFT_479976 [Xylariaceae sp. FL1651]
MTKITTLMCHGSLVMAAATSRSWCMDPKDGQKLASRYADLIGAFTPEKAEVLLADDFTDTSDSINTLSSKPLGSVTFPSKQDFIREQSQQPIIPLNITSVDATTCDTVVLRWTQEFGAISKPVAGISVLVACMQDDDWRIKAVHTEFNSVIYWQDMGGLCSMPGLLGNRL